MYVRTSHAVASCLHRPPTESAKLAHAEEPPNVRRLDIETHVTERCLAVVPSARLTRATAAAMVAIATGMPQLTLIPRQTRLLPLLLALLVPVRHVVVRGHAGYRHHMWRGRSGSIVFHVPDSGATAVLKVQP